MATKVPAKLKQHDIARFATRGSQLERFKPPVAYWCYYWVVKQIIAKGLHNADDECKQYTTTLMDKLEELKTKHSNDAAILEDTAGKDFVEHFALDTFEKAERTMRANHVTMTTVETFHAAATFLDVLQIWNPPTPEVTQKVKYAKYHALRIAKALKAGEDPNLTNPPPPEPEPSADDIKLDPNDPEVQKINGTGRQPSVEDVPDEHEHIQAGLARQSSLDQSLHPSRTASTAPAPGATDRQRMWPPPRAQEDPGYFNQTPLQPRISPPLEPATDGKDSAPVSPPTPNPPLLPQAPVSPDTSEAPPSEFGHPAPPPPQSPQDFYTQQPSPAPSAPFQQPFTPHQPQEPQRPTQDYPPPPLSQPQPQKFAPPPQNYVSPPPPQNYSSPPQHNYPPPPPQPQAHIPPPSMPQQQSFNTDDQAVADAQKHAKWAISALNFEDVNTAVKELRIALNALGAQ